MFLWLVPAAAQADTSASLTVIGTSDVSDSGLMTNVIQPAFAKAHPNYTFKYIGTATGAAISSAESGAQGASVLIVHASSLENQFVGGGFSLEQYGRALFINDFVLAGPKSDPAAVGTTGAHNIAQAFADVAAAGINGGGTPKATFVSRGGTPGTTVQEHKIWALVSSSGLAPAGLLLCTVNTTSGGGETPIAPGNGVTASGQPCPNSGALPTGSALPSWYAVTSLTQGPNVQNADACNGYPSGANSCYVFTDRGTFDYLASGTDPAGSIPNLSVVTRDNAPTAPGGAFELVNYFHGYIINPKKAGETVNQTAAQDFLNLLTSQALQASLKTYLPTGDPGGAPFIADAAPLITASSLPANYTAGKPITVSGTVANAEPGYPAPAGKPVSVQETVGSLTTLVASTTTSSTGAYSISFVPPSTGSYQVVTPQIAQVEISTLTPPFGDLLSPGATTAAKITVHSTLSNLRARSLGGRALVLGSVAPGTGHLKAVVTILARPQGSHRAFKQVGHVRLLPTQSNFALAVPLKTGRWQLKVTYADPGTVVGASKTLTVRVAAAPASSVGFGSIKVKHGALTVTGKLSPKAAKGARVQVLVLNTDPGHGASFRVLKTVKVQAGHRSVTIHATLKLGQHWIVQLVYLPPRRAAASSGLRTVAS